MCKHRYTYLYIYVYILHTDNTPHTQWQRHTQWMFSFDNLLPLVFSYSGKKNTTNSICIELYLQQLYHQLTLYPNSINSNYTTPWIHNTCVCFNNFGSLASLKYPALPLLPLTGLAQVSFFSSLISYITGETNCSLVLCLHIFPIIILVI